MMTVKVEFVQDISANAVGYSILTNGAIRKKNKRDNFLIWKWQVMAMRNSHSHFCVIIGIKSDEDY